MPYKGLHNGDAKPPQSVPEKTTVECPECGDAMHVVKSHERETGAFVSRHFRHNRDDGHGGGGGGRSCGESDEHIKLKSIAASKLEHIFEDNCWKYELEYTFGNTATDADHRQADALLLFDDPDEQLGQGVAVEVQYKNDSKDKHAVEKDYIENNISTVWVTPEDFGDHDMRLNEADIRDRARRAVWPEHAPDRRTWWTPEHSPDHLRWENNGVDRFQIGRLDVMSDRHSRELSVPATFREPLVDTIRYRESDWSALFTDYPERHFRLQTTVPRIDSGTSIPAFVAEEWLDTQRYTTTAWSSLFDDNKPEWWQKNPTQPDVDVPFPPEYAEKHRETLSNAWHRGKGEYNFDLCYELSENNSGRNCADCGDEADVYLFQDNVISEYRCYEHMPAGV